MPTKEVATKRLENITGIPATDTGSWLQLATPEQFRKLAEKLRTSSDQLTQFVCSLIALEMSTLYPYQNSKFWWEEYVRDDKQVIEAVMSELERIMLGASRMKRVCTVAHILEKTYRNAGDSVFVVLDTSTASAYADLPRAEESLSYTFLPNATYFQGLRQLRGFNGGRTAYASLGEQEPTPRSGCLRRAFEDVSGFLDIKALSENIPEGASYERNGLKMTRVKNHPNYVVISGKVERPLDIIGQYNQDEVSPQEYILLVMYGCFSNEPVVAIENLDPTPHPSST